MAKYEPILTTTDSLLKPELVFFGSGYISHESLRAVMDVFAIEAVITKPALGAHKSQSTTRVEELADEHGLDVFKASTKSELRELFKSHSFRSQLGLVVDYGVIIPGEVIDYFPLGIVNSHFSLLPKYRGADPIRSAIVNRDNTTGISLIKITPNLDDGPIISQTEIELNGNETAKDLTATLLDQQADWLPSSLLAYSHGDTELTDQNESKATYTSQLTKADGKINWTEPAATIEAKIRAYAGWPTTYTTLAGKQVTLLQAEVMDSQPVPDNSIGDAYESDDSLIVNCGNNTALSIKQLKVHGKNEVSAKDFVNGYLSVESD